MFVYTNKMKRFQISRYCRNVSVGFQLFSGEHTNVTPNNSNHATFTHFTFNLNHFGIIELIYIYLRTSDRNSTNLSLRILSRLVILYGKTFRNIA
ncbi:hypothetical protein BpHYR1_021073 [Brachionus plicatilis]|uniref:Uncharacterized protein n=1 Tax=Brachionus plicatilis TaxID=10195 RepID=A0A3M7PED0_BRAPC|nr:hypothetical protein BpHYR1_021073 [Brachionus plicatilis]